jgi:hypothetical protein
MSVRRTKQYVNNAFMYGTCSVYILVIQEDNFYNPLKPGISTKKEYKDKFKHYTVFKSENSKLISCTLIVLKRVINYLRMF